LPKEWNFVALDKKKLRDSEESIENESSLWEGVSEQREKRGLRAHSPQGEKN